MLIDIKNAFPHVSRNRLAQKIKRTGVIEDEFIAWTLSVMSDRRVRIKMRGEDLGRSREIETGIPQGSPLSPFLFLIYIADMFKDIEGSRGVKILSFADNVMVMIRDKSLIRVGHRATEIREDIRAWGRANNVELNNKKTELIALMRARTKLARALDSRFGQPDNEL